VKHLPDGFLVADSDLVGREGGAGHEQGGREVPDMNNEAVAELRLCGRWCAVTEAPPPRWAMD
jgi:hypothetical protein